MLCKSVVLREELMGSGSQVFNQVRLSRDSVLARTKTGSLHSDIYQLPVAYYCWTTNLQSTVLYYLIPDVRISQEHTRILKSYYHSRTRYQEISRVHCRVLFTSARVGIRVLFEEKDPKYYGSFLCTCDPQYYGSFLCTIYYGSFLCTPDP